MPGRCFRPGNPGVAAGIDPEPAFRMAPREPNQVRVANPTNRRLI
ncbi:tegument protein US11 [Mobiluncus mulieris]|nr:tegument protein US11 [Mobiluncus mulieris]MCV0013261.1 tegument protein US11 [Mobiluncus mulieris]NMW60388.1 tegument protein US11 [Mobiluncus mulieris]NMW63462.1 tegument protein US11 [Mobiluncus mulieris]